jgi:hypothetical protein
MTDPPTREIFLETQLGELDGHWLEIYCGGCGARTFYPCKLLAKERGTMPVADALPRLRCQHCKARPVRVLMTNNPARGLQYADVWRVSLVGE